MSVISEEKDRQDTALISLLQESQNIVVRLQKQIEEMKPSVVFATKVMDDGRFYSMKEAADLLTEAIKDETGLKIGRNKLFIALRDIGILSSSESNWNEPYRNFIDDGYFHVKLKETQVGFTSVTLVTGKGLEYIRRKVTEYYADNMEL